MHFLKIQVGRFFEDVLIAVNANPDSQDLLNTRCKILQLRKSANLKHPKHWVYETCRLARPVP
ncbi:MAG: putative membrane protein [Mariniblastus sp.]|jgi:uncharacterized membrane protein